MSPLIIRQLRSADGTGTLSYLLMDESTRRAAVIDPNADDIDRWIGIIKEHRAVPDFIIDTHTHVDHRSGANDLRRAFGATVVMHERTKEKWKVVDQGDAFGIGDILRANAQTEVDRYVRDGDTLSLGSHTLTLLHTPGHTDNHLSVFAEGNLFTGDLLLIGQAGRSDLPGGDPGEQYDSFVKKILPLPDSTKIYPGHDYDDNEFSLLGNEKRSNPFLQQPSKEKFKEFVKEFFPPVADAAEGGKMILQCGTKRVTTAAESFVNISPEQLDAMLHESPPPFVLDVREPKELSMFGFIPTAVNIPTRHVSQRLQDLPPRSEKIVVVCQSGGRSYEIAHLLVQQGFRSVYNLESGTMGWMMSGKNTEKPTV